MPLSLTEVVKVIDGERIVICENRVMADIAAENRMPLPKEHVKDCDGFKKLCEGKGYSPYDCKWDCHSLPFYLNGNGRRA
ncbi:MAG: hypothetical protein AABX71_02860 [Nanoarchaeota archaeon]